jgi:uncharacterized protein (TIGR00730 family)
LSGHDKRKDREEMFGMKRICVFAGSNPGAHPAFAEGAARLGEALVHRGIELVYGGSRLGLMGIVADTVIQKDGTAIGVMPKGLFRGEAVHRGLTRLIEVRDMHARKAKMSELADAFIALPGGFGTFEEVFEAVSWAQLGIHQKPLGLLNVNGYYEPLLALVDRGIGDGFIPSAQRGLVLCDGDPDRLIEKLIHYQPPARVNKWSELEEAERV